MRDVMNDVSVWQEAGKEIVLATVVKAYGSAMRPIGSKMAISSAGDISGSVSGGCVESAVYQEAQEVFKNRQAKLVSYGIADETAWSVGLTCGGTIEVFLDLMDEDLGKTLIGALQADELIGYATVLTGAHTGERLLLWPDGDKSGHVTNDSLAERIATRAEDLFQRHESQKLEIETDEEEAAVFFQVYPPSPRLVVVGAVHIAVPLVALGNTMGFRTIVVDARSAFATTERFPHAGEMLVQWPAEALESLHLDEGSYIAILSHDAKFDIPALQVAVQSKARYVGVLASKHTYHLLHEALREEGVPEDLLEKVHTPIGIKKLGARGPEGIAFSIMAEMIAEMRGVKVS
jgi:xanthine dehydrogenase accessory factor